jgi:hypothetical protein
MDKINYNEVEVTEVEECSVERKKKGKKILKVIGIGTAIVGGSVLVIKTLTSIFGKGSNSSEDYECPYYGTDNDSVESDTDSSIE